MWAQMPVDGQIRWEKTVKSFLLAFQYSQGGKKQACNTLNNLKKKEKKRKLILPLCIFKHAPRVSHSPSCVLIPADISLFTPGIPLSVFSAYLNLSQVSEPNSDSTCSGGPVLITLPETLSLAVLFQQLQSRCIIWPMLLNSWLPTIFPHIQSLSLLLDYKHFVGWIDLKLPL